MLLTQLEYFVAVAREQHFGRAAAACYVSPSTLSEAIRKLEIDLGVPLVRRGRAFEGLTAEGELAVVWAQRVLADDRAMRDDLAAARNRLATTVRFGVIPSAIARAAGLLTVLAQRHPLTRVRMLTGLTTEEIVGRIRRYELEAGLIHPMVDAVEDLAITPLYEDVMVVVARDDILPASKWMSGEALSRLPLGLLEPHMRARQLLDTAFREAGLELRPRFEADSIEGLLALARETELATVVPRSAVDGALDGRALGMRPLSQPEVRIPIALARLAEAPRSPIAAALDGAIDPAPPKSTR